MPTDLSVPRRGRASMPTLLRAIVLITAAVCCALVVASFSGWTVRQQIPASAIASDDGLAYVARLPSSRLAFLYRIATDTSADPTASELQLLEDGRSLGPAHSAHDAIRTDGRGRFSHWNEATALYFSTSDGSDPRTNGRGYEVINVIRVAPAVGAVAALVLLALAWPARRQIVSPLRRAGSRALSLSRRPGPHAILAAVAAALAGWLALQGLPIAQRVPVAGILHAGSHLYHVELPHWAVPWPLAIAFDSSDGPADSIAQLRENGRLLGPAHSLHDTIRAAGGGRFSHWGNARTLYFSASDNTDPRANGREYVLESRARGPLWLLAVAIAFGALAAFSLWRLARAASAQRMATRSATSPAAAPSRLIRAARTAGRPLAWIGRNVFAPILATAFAILLLLLAGEAYFRFTVPFTDKTWPIRYVDDIGWLFEPNSMVRLTNDLDFWAEEKTNSLGFLDRELPQALPATACKVAFIGDSFVEAAQVRNDEKMQALLERLAAQDGRLPRVAAAAFGYSGTGQLNQIPFYERYARDFGPAVVVLVFVVNDFANNSSVLEAVRHGFHPDHPPRVYAVRGDDGKTTLLRPDPAWSKHLIPLGDEVVAPTCALCSMHRRLISVSLFYRWVTLKLRLIAPSLLAPLEPPAAKAVTTARIEWLENNVKLTDGFGQWRGETDIDALFSQSSLPPVFERAVEYTGFALAEFKRRVEHDGGKLVLLAASNVRGLDPVNGDVYGKRLRALTDHLGIDVLDQYEWLKKRNEDPTSVQFRHDGHWNLRGHEVAAQMVLEYLQGNPAACQHGPSNSPRPSLR